MDFHPRISKIAGTPADTGDSRKEPIPGDSLASGNFVDDLNVDRTTRLDDVEIVDPSTSLNLKMLFDAGSDPANPRWLMVDVRFRRKFKRPVTLRELKSKKRLANMRLVQRGNRLSILPVTATEWRYILQMAGET